MDAELAVRPGEPLALPVSVPDVLAAADVGVHAIEVVDPRIADWDVTAPEAVADNALSGRVVLGGRARDPATLDTDLALEGVQVRRNGEAAATGVGAECSVTPRGWWRGWPARSPTTAGNWPSATSC